jgi:hypothetical protein
MFSAPMVRALLGGQKTQTRRLTSSPLARAMPGDRLWVREAFLWTIPGIGARYRADEDRPEWRGLWKPSIHMPRRISRITLTVSAVRLTHLQDITEEDAAAEGTREPSLRDLGGELRQAAWTERQVFARLWSHLHGADAWDSNPLVVALTFCVTEQNIDRVPHG